MKQPRLSDFLKILELTGLSPEALSGYFGIASITLRRWKESPRNKPIPQVYQQAIAEGVYRLLIEKKLDASSPDVTRFLATLPTLSFEAAIRSLGAEDLLQAEGKADYNEKFCSALSHIGMSEAHRSEVEANREKIRGFQKLSREWSDRVSALSKVVFSAKLSSLDKMVAYGALFYLIFPLDLIPDHIPVVGLLDDYAVLGIAAAYYLKRYPDLFKEPKQ
jgi:uncharacterized membrane protein YkvA (DUF1232 family)